MPKKLVNRVEDDGVKLPAVQRKVLEQMCQGESATETALRNGVSRSTVYRWIKEDAAFGNAYNKWHLAMAETARARLISIADLAVDTIRESLKKGDAKTALKLLEKMEVLESRRRSVERADFDERFNEGFEPNEKEFYTEGENTVKRVAQRPPEIHLRAGD